MVSSLKENIDHGVLLERKHKSWCLACKENIDHGVLLAQKTKTMVSCLQRKQRRCRLAGKDQREQQDSLTKDNYRSIKRGQPYLL